MPSIYYCQARDFTPVAQLPLETLLDDEERARLARMVEPVGARFAQARWMVKSLLAERLALPLDAIRFHYSDKGKPYLADYPNEHFSISHCDDAVAVALSEQPIGVDVELIERRRGKLEPPWENPGVFMHEHTAHWITAAPAVQKPDIFTLLWTLLESQVKVCDSSIVVASRHLKIDVDTHATPWQLKFVSCNGLAPVIWQSYFCWGHDPGKRIISVAQEELLAEEIQLWDWPSRHTLTLEPMAISQGG